MKNKILASFATGTSLLILIRSDLIESYFFENNRGSFLTNNLEFIHNVLLLFPLVLFFSIITYKMPERIFRAWWGFARIAVPVILFLTVVINLKLHHSPGGWMNMDADVDRAAFLLMYIVFVIGSLIQIARGYFQK